MKPPETWTLEGLIEFERAAAHPDAIPAETLRAVSASGKSDRHLAFRELSAALPHTGTGARFTGALSLVAMLAAVAGFLTGAGGVIGLMDHARGGMSVPLFLLVLLGTQWLMLALAAITFVTRRGKAGIGLLRNAIAKIAGRLAGPELIGSAARQVILWRAAGITQSFGVWLNLGILATLGGLVLIRHIGFFWETTTIGAMQELLGNMVSWLSLPWQSWWPDAVPSAEVIAASRWKPGQSLAPGPGEWWRFLLMAIAVWGLLPRLLLRWAAASAARRKLARPDFDSPALRSLWRTLRPSAAVVSSEPVTDGVLVIDVGGIGIRPDDLRPFLLRHLRVNPSSWHTTMVLDHAREKETSMAISRAPAGAVLVCSDWSLAPRPLARLHAELRKKIPAHPIRFLIVGMSEDRVTPPAEIHRGAWLEFVDSLRDPDAEVVFLPDPHEAP